VDAGGALDGRGCLRTAKACGPDAPVLASSSRQATFAGDGGKKADRRGERATGVKTIARGMPGVFRRNRGD